MVVLGYPLCLKKWQSTNVYLYNLAMSDIICVCALPRLSYLYANNTVEDSSVFCVLNCFLLFVNMYSSVLFMALVSLDRYLLLCHPMRTHALLSPRGAIFVCLIAWVYVIAIMSPLLYYNIRYLVDTQGAICTDFASLSKTWGFLGFSLGLTLMGYILPLVALFLCTRKITSMLKTQEEAFNQRATSFRKPLRIVKIAAYAFLLFYLPYHVMRNVRVVSQIVGGLSKCALAQIEAVYIVTRPMAYAHSVINPVFYFMMTDCFRELLLARFHQLRRVIRSS